MCGCRLTYIIDQNLMCIMQEAHALLQKIGEIKMKSKEIKEIVVILFYFIMMEGMAIYIVN